jgi:hypothetical protein
VVFARKGVEDAAESEQEEKREIDEAARHKSRAVRVDSELSCHNQNCVLPFSHSPNLVSRCPEGEARSRGEKILIWNRPQPIEKSGFGRIDASKCRQVYLHSFAFIWLCLVALGMI